MGIDVLLVGLMKLLRFANKMVIYKKLIFMSYKNGFSRDNEVSKINFFFPIKILLSIQ